jgi:hypothetical protein
MSLKRFSVTTTSKAAGCWMSSMAAESTRRCSTMTSGTRAQLVDDLAPEAEVADVGLVDARQPPPTTCASLNARRTTRRIHLV